MSVSFTHSFCSVKSLKWYQTHSLASGTSVPKALGVVFALPAPPSPPIVSD
jgi:hypothetical protein